MKTIDWSVHNKLPWLRAYLATACSLKRVQKTCHHLQTSSEGAVGGTKRTKAAAAALFWTWFGSAARWCRVQLQAKMQSHLVESALGKARTPRCKGTDYMGCISLLHHKGLACKFLFATKFTLIGPCPQRDQAGVDSAHWTLVS